MLRLLCVTAHPDDEAGNFGGILLRYAERGVQTYVICLTPGQAATHRGMARSDKELAALRREEFQASCRLLEVHRGEVLDFPDGALDRADFHAMVGELVRRIREIRPQVMVTMGAEGAVTGHPDHSMSSLCGTIAFHWAGRSNRFAEQLTHLKPHCAQKLYHGTADFTLPNRQPVHPAPISASINIAPYVSAKVAAFKLHTTQAPLFPLFEKHVSRSSRGVELYHLAASSLGSKAEWETDLFAGVVED